VTAPPIPAARRWAGQAPQVPGNSWEPARRVPARPRAALALWRVETVLLLRDPILWAGAAASGGLLVLSVWEQAPVLHRDTARAPAALLALALAAMLATNRAALRHARDGAGELLLSLPTPPRRRTAALLAAGGAPVLVAALLATAFVAALLAGGAVGRVDVAALALGSALVGAGAALGVLVAACTDRAPAAALVAACAVAALGLTPARLLLPSLPAGPWALDWWAEAGGPPPPGVGSLFVGAGPVGEMGVRLAVRELAVVAAAGATAAAAALARARVPRAAVGAGAGALLTLLAALGQQAAVPARVHDRQLAFATADERVQTCLRAGEAEYCAYRDYEPWVERWRPAVDGVLARVPGDRTAAPLRVRQVWRTHPDGLGLDPAAMRRILAGIQGVRAESDVLVGTGWGTGRGREDAELVLAAAVGAHAVGLPVEPRLRTLAELDEAAARGSTAPGDQVHACVAADQAREVVALWLAGQATPGAGRSLVRSAGGPGRYATLQAPRLYLWSDVALTTDSYRVLPGGAGVSWSSAGVWSAARLLERPDAEVAAVLAAHWDELRDPATPVDRLRDLLRLPPPPDLPDPDELAPPPAVGVPDDREVLLPCA